MDFRLTEEQQILRRSVREFAEREMRPHVMAWDQAQHFPSELIPKLAALGLLGIQIPETYGGAGMSAIDYCICIEELARVDPGVALSVAAHNGLCTAHIVLFGTEEQKGRQSVPLAQGEKIGAWGLTESAAGKKEDKLGMRASETSEVLFENCSIPAGQRLGEEGQGFVNAMQVLDSGRIGIAALSVGLAQGAWEAALRYSKQRNAFGKAIS